MTIPHRFSISFIGLLAILSNGLHCLAELNNEPVCQKIPEGYRLIFRSDGVEPNYKPYAMKKLDELGPTRTYILFNNKPNSNCTLTVEDTGVLDYIYQVSEEKTVIVWYHPEKKPKAFTMKTVDLRTCASKDASQHFYENESWKDHYLFIIHANGYEVIVDENGIKLRVSYDLDGNQVGQPKAFFAKPKVSFHSISPKSRSANLVENRSYQQGYVRLHDADGHFMKNLLNFTGEALRSTYSISHSLYANCYQNKSLNLIECVQFDEFGHEKYRNSTNYDEDLMDVRNLKDGGVVLFIAIDTGIRVVEMRPGKTMEKTYSIPVSAVYGQFISDFNESKRQFTLRMLSHEDERNICWQTYSFPSEFQ